MKVMILGATGFIGINLILALLKYKDCEITAVSKNIDKLDNLKKLTGNRIKIYHSDLKKESCLVKLFAGQDIIYHLISTTVPTTSNCRIDVELRDNVELMTNILEACVTNNIKRIIYLSSGGTVYGVQTLLPVKESAETNPINSYGVHKVMNEKLLYLYWYIHGLDYRIIRLSNPYGPYQRTDGVQGVVAHFIKCALNQEQIIVYGDGETIRDYIYITDAVTAIINIAMSDSEQKLYNVGSGEGTSLNNLIDLISEVMGVALDVIYKEKRNIDVPKIFLDVSRYEKSFGRIGFISLKDGIDLTKDFFSNGEGKNNV